MLSRKHGLWVLSAAVSATLAAGCATNEKPDVLPDAPAVGSEMSADSAFPSATPSNRSREPNPSAIIRDPWRTYSTMRDNLGR